MVRKHWRCPLHFLLGLCVSLVVYFMDRASSIRLREGVRAKRCINSFFFVVRKHCLGTLVLTFKCISQIQGDEWQVPRDSGEAWRTLKLMAGF